MANAILDQSNLTPSIILNAEKAYSIELTDEAKDLINLPIDELIVTRRQFIWDDVNVSVHKLFESMTKDFNPGARDAKGKLTSMAVIRSYWENFCSIPPFCASTAGANQQGTP